MPYYGYDCPDLIEVDDRIRVLDTNEFGVVIDVDDEGNLTALIDGAERIFYEDQIERTN